MAKSKYKEKFNSEDGVWRTIGGRRVFIKKGQSLSDAMKESGKFKQGNRREVQQAIAEKRVDKLGKKNTELYRKYGGFADTGNVDRNREVDKAHKKWLDNSREANDLKQMYNDYSPLEWEMDNYNNPKEADKTYDLVGQHINKKQQLGDISRRANKEDDELSRISGGAISTLKTSVPQRKADRLKVGAEIYYKGDQANTPGYFTIESYEPEKEQFMSSLTLKEKGGEGRTKKIGAQQIEDSYTNNYASRFAFKEDYDNYRNQVYENYRKIAESKKDNDDYRMKMLNDDKIRISDKYENRNGVPLRVIAKDISDRYIVNEAGNEYRVKEDELRGILKDGGYKKVEYDGLKKEAKEKTPAYKDPDIQKQVAINTAKMFGAKEVNVNGEKIDLSDGGKKEYNPFVTEDERVSVVGKKDFNNGKGFIGYDKENNAYHNAYKRRDGKDVNTSGPYRTFEEAERDLVNTYGGTKYTADEQDILDRFGEDYGYDKGDKLSNLKGQIDNMRNPGESINRTAQRLVDGGDFLVWNGDVEKWLSERNIKFNADNYWDVYKKEMADKIESLYNRATTSNIKVRFKGTYEELKKHTDMSESEILEFLKKLESRKK